ncbi:hypothetical protein K503DRAFT_868575 [Rhizopogon vinicolor AM-OR11-026]|uniref:Uncharacterized protein n=1 Tax=Rhizopogon vinicolor AM-OR11-026 TaxID=1314800 RepID=A0A1B7MQT6_9AGAM|nr:hypothetical protein K503DRAFT_868575 [Rhizopogon vinicolor AM-OR11-026]
MFRSDDLAFDYHTIKSVDFVDTVSEAGIESNAALCAVRRAQGASKGVLYLQTGREQGPVYLVRGAQTMFESPLLIASLRLFVYRNITSTLLLLAYQKPTPLVCVGLWE